jgi:3-methylfumaryl-CoA hydratase
MAAAKLSDWIGRAETREIPLATVVMRQLAATVPECGIAPERVEAGGTLPALWHWAAVQPHVAMDQLGTDGHPRLGGFLPPVDLGRRMWAGSRVEFLAPMTVGETVSWRSEIRDIQEKQGSAGRMVFVTVGHEVAGEAGPAVREEQDIVYLPMPDSYRPPERKPAPEAPDFDQRVAIDTPRLFRYSAVTFNAHRIHYDRPYASEVEKYPGLVVHAPLQATLLLGAAIRHKGSTPRHFRFRGVHPMFDFHDLRLVGLDDGDGLELCTAAPEGHQGLKARADWGPQAGGRA